MSKQEFLDQLRAGLAGLPQQDINERLTFYSEMIDDRIEEGLTEEAAVAGMDSVDSIVSQTLSEIPLSKIVKERVSSKRSMPAWAIILIIIGAPVWIPLLLSFFIIILSFYVVIWSIVFALWATVVGIGLSSVASLAAGVILMCLGHGITGVLLISAFLVLVGLTILFVFLSIALTKAMAILTGVIASGIKRMFIRKEK
jgi:uncharacterized membrane protein